MTARCPRRTIRRLACAGLASLALPVAAASDVEPLSRPEPESMYPVNEHLSYAVSWAGIHCGEMVIVTFRETSAAGEVVDRIVVLMRTSRFFDSIYRVRSRLDSFFDPVQMSSFRYEEHSLEKKKRKDEVWEVDHEAAEVTRTKNGAVTQIPLEVERTFDPLAFIFSLRGMDLEIGSEISLELMTSKGALDTVARATERKEVRTKLGRRDAVAVVPEPRDKMMFSKSGAMVVWVETEPPHRPCRIEFDLSFGRLVASLKSHRAGGAADLPEDWESWGD